MATVRNKQIRVFRDCPLVAVGGENVSDGRWTFWDLFIAINLHSTSEKNGSFLNVIARHSTRAEEIDP